MVLPDVAHRPVIRGHAKPRIAPPTPARSDLAGFRKIAADLGIDLMPWQATAGRYLEATGPQGRHLYREVVIEVARQNGKTWLLEPLIVKRLKAGRRITHTAQDRKLPLEIFERVATAVEQAGLAFGSRNGRARRPRFANGQEEIVLANGGRYRIVAPTRAGARGGTNDDVIVDELREHDTFDFMAAAKPTMTVSRDPQIVYLSNAGDASSVVLNSLREKAGKDPRLAYLSWSASPDRAADDVIAWAEANPAIGHIPTMLGYLEDEYLSNKLAGTLSIWETEHLCRSVASLREVFVDGFAWSRGEFPGLEEPTRPFLGVSMDPSGSRASAAAAWARDDGTIGLRLLFNVTGSPIDIDELGRDIRERAREIHAIGVGYDPLTDAQLARFLPRAEPVTGGKYANASARFAGAIEAGKLRWSDSHAVGDDLTWTARKPHDESGSFQAVRAQDDRPITAAHAAIRAVWLASTPRPAARRPGPAAVAF